MKLEGWRRAGAALMMLCGIAAGRAAPLPAEAFFQRPAIQQIQLSPSGKRLAFTTGKGQAHTGLAVMELDGEPRVHWVAGFSDADVGRFEWVGDDRLVFTAIDLDEGSAEDYYSAPGLFSTRVDGQEQRQLVLRKNRPIVGGPMPEELLSWNHTLLAIPARSAKDEVIVGRLDVRRGEVVAVTPMWLNTRTGRSHPLDLRDAPSHVLRWGFDGDGTPRTAVTRADDREALYWRDPASGAWRRLAEAPLDKLPFQPVGWDAQDRLFITHRAGEGRWQAMTTFDFAARRPADKDLLTAPGFDLRPQLVLDPDSRRLLGVRIETDAETSIWYDATLKQIQAQVDALLPAWSNRIDCRRCGQPDRVVLVRSSSGQDPGRLWLYREGAEKPLRLLNTIQPGIDPVAMATVSFERIKARDGEDLPLWVTRPAQAAEGAPLPTVVMVHGGPWVRGGHWKWDAMNQFLASRGYQVIEPEFRGSAGYGLRHERAGDRQWGQAMQTDVADALLWAQKKGLASDRACIMGASYGGYAVLMGLVRDPALYRCGVEWVGVADLDLYVDGSWWVLDDISDSGRRILLPERVGKLPEDAEMIHANSPVRLAERIKAPLLMAYGGGDRRVPVTHGERMRAALRKAGQEPEWVVYDGEGHGWRLERNQVDFARRVEAFLARHLAPAGTP